MDETYRDDFRFDPGLNKKREEPES